MRRVLAVGLVAGVGVAAFMLRGRGAEVAPVAEAAHAERAPVPEQTSADSPPVATTAPRASSNAGLREEALRGLHVLDDAERAHYGEHDRYTDDLRGLEVELGPCADGSDRAIPDLGARNQRIGCHFVFAVELPADPAAGCRLSATGAAAASQGLELELSQGGPSEGIVIDATTGKPATPRGAITFEALAQEASVNLKSLFTAEKSFMAEKDSYSARPDEIGFVPATWCPDGARLSIPAPSAENQARGCHFLYEIELRGAGMQSQFTGWARGAVPESAGQVFRIASDGESPGVPVQER
jgi:hypothetical protein